ncbi:arf-GAP domain and FG repeat-containing protein 1-like [Anneissia japonica]|uniref:arf-GAP domain and FG repeat-containing protein 1-like n=1 Tax=Anneissia japonica TaxID=1529436 RepID=UPI0014255560|nr:arf-GAP domain and FG repeat-containing protein 1-like [Anneissia japonica]
MASKRKQDDKHLKILREMVAKEHNKTCFDCHQRGPTYVNMKIGSFVCTSCSGILRGINPPHRVKSISMASYSPEEIEFLQNHGNEVCRQIWLGLYDSKSRAEPESKEEQKVKDFMIQKYERKRWYVEPSQAAAVANQKAKEQKQKEKEAAEASSRFPEPKPLKSLISEPPKLVVGRQNKSSPNRKPVGSIATPLAEAPVPPVAKPSTDLLADLGGDPFGSAPSAGGSAGGFADFGAAFGGTPSPFVAQPTQSTQPFGAQSSQQAVGGGFSQQTQPPQQNAAIAAFMQQSQGTSSNQGGFASFPATSSTPSNINQTSQGLQNLNISQPAASSTSDKYAALSSLLESSSSADASINWGGGGTSSSSSIDWGISGNSSSTSLGSAKSTPPTMVGVGGPGMNASKFGGATQGNNFSSAFGTPPSSNAFGTQPGMNAFGVQQQTNAFGTQQTSAFGASQAMNAFGAVPMSNAFGATPNTNTFGAQKPNPYGQASVNNPFAGVGAPTQSTASNPFLGMGSTGQMPQSNGMYGGGGAAAGQPGFGQFGAGQAGSQFGMPAQSQMNGNFTQMQQQTMSFGGVGMTAMAANQFGKPPQNPGFGQQAFGGTAAAPVAAGGFQSWNSHPQPVGASASNPFMGGGFMSQSAAPKPQGSSNNPFL